MKMSITTSDTQQMKDHLLSLPKQGSFPANAQDDNQALWSEVISTLPEQTFKFILNASLDTLPTNHNLFLWKKRPTCVVQYVHYVINPMNLSYNILYMYITHVMTQSTKRSVIYFRTSTSDWNHYCGSPRLLVFLPYTYYSLLRSSRYCLGELTIQFETTFDAAQERKSILTTE